MSERAVVLVSGGMDSAVVLAEMRSAGFACIALSFDYGQRHRVELEAASAVARSLGAIEHRISHIDLRAFGGSALTSDIPVPKDRPLAEDGAASPTSASARTAPPAASSSAVPVTYVPARNTIFLAHALALAEVSGARRLGIGVNAVDYSGYPDCRPAFIDAFVRLANVATRDGIESAARGEAWLRVDAPLLSMSKADIVRRGIELGVDFAQTFSCYDPQPAESGARMARETPAGAPRAGERTASTRFGPRAAAARFGVVPCGHCDACRLRARGFAEAGVADPQLAMAARTH